MSQSKPIQLVVYNSKDDEYIHLEKDLYRVNKTINKLRAFYLLKISVLKQQIQNQELKHKNKINEFRYVENLHSH